MKKLYSILLLIILMSCVTNKTETSIEPLWFSDSYEVLSSERYLVYKAMGSSKTEAYNKIMDQTEFLKNNIEPKLEKEFVNSNGTTYLVYSIKKSDLEIEFLDDINSIFIEYKNIINLGDSTSDILDKVKYYKNALVLYDDVVEIENFAKSLDIEINSMELFYLDDLKENIEFTMEQLVFSVNVVGDINGSIKSIINSELNKKGYKTSDDGIVMINTVLTLQPANLNNNYLNKYWNLSLSIDNLYGSSNNSVSFKGRVSQVDEDSLNQLILRVVSQKVTESLDDLLP